MSEEAPKSRESGVTRIVGFDDESTERGFLSFFKHIFENQRIEPEKEKSPELKDVIERLDSLLNEFLNEYGGEPLTLRADHVHIIDTQKLTEEQRIIAQKYDEKGVKGFFSSDRQAIIMLEGYEENKLRFAQLLAHEMIHAHSFNSYQKSQVEQKRYFVQDKDTGETESVGLKARRLGFEINSSDGAKKYFRDINEAITEELARRFDFEYFGQIPELTEECIERNASIKKNLLENEDEESLRFQVSQITTRQLENGRWGATIFRWRYHDERLALRTLINELYQQNKDQFSSYEEIFGLFAKVVMTGQLLPVARLIEKTFGKGSFRNIAEETAESSDKE